MILIKLGVRELGDEMFCSLLSEEISCSFEQMFMLVPLQIANALVFFQLTSFIVRLIKRFRVSVWRNNELHCPLVSFSTCCINVVYTECSPWTERT